MAANNSAQFEELRKELLAHGSAKFPPLRGEMDDIVADTLADLVEYMAGREGRTFDPVTARKLAYTIFRRRAVDVLRQGARRLSVDIDEIAETQPAPVGDPARAALLGRVLRICVRELAAMSPDDRLLVSLAAGLTYGNDGPMTPADRQRLHRLRTKLSDAIEAELGQDAAKILREDV